MRSGSATPRECDRKMIRGCLKSPEGARCNSGGRSVGASRSAAPGKRPGGYGALKGRNKVRALCRPFRAPSIKPAPYPGLRPGLLHLAPSGLSRQMLTTHSNRGEFKVNEERGFV